MKVARIASFGLSVLLVFIPGFLALDASAAPPSSSGFNNKSDEDEGLGSAQGEIERVITPEYRRRGMRVEKMSNGNLRVLLPSGSCSPTTALTSAAISPPLCGKSPVSCFAVPGFRPMSSATPTATDRTAITSTSRCAGRKAWRRF